MHSTHPLDLPDIISYVAGYVPKPSLPACARVSRTWYLVFIPLIWEEIKVTYRSQPPEAIWEHVHLIKELDLCDPPKEYATLSCPNLKSLDARCQGYTDLILNHPTITSLRLWSLHPSPSSEIWSRLLGFHNLRELRLVLIDIDTKDTDTFWQLCTHLERAYLRDLTLSGRGSLSSMEFPRMKELELWNFTGGDGGSVSLEFMRKCPGLVSCYWSIYPDGEHQAFPGFLRSLDAKTWPNLHRLNIQGAVEEDTFVKTIQGIERITHLTALCAYSSFAPTSMAMLRQHFVNLRGLDLKWTGNNVMFPMAQEILSSCPLLESFSSTWIDATLVASGNPWVCLGLQRLELSFSFTPSTICLVQPLVFEQLSRLKRLRHLRLWKCDDASNKKVEFQEAVDLRLENGLNKLSTLRGLQTIDWGMTKQKMGEKEVNWIIEHWKSLERIRGRLDTSVYKVDKALCLRLISCGITC